MAPFSKEDKSMYEYKGYKARLFITEFPDRGWRKNYICRLLVKLRKFGTVNMRPGSGRRRSARTDKNVDTVSRWYWVRKTNLRATEQSQKFHVRRGSIGRQFRGLFTKICVSSAHERARSTAVWRNMHSLFSVCSLRDDNVITSKPIWKLKHTNSILQYFEYFCQMSSKSILTIFSHIVSKLVRFLRQCSYLMVGLASHWPCVTDSVVYPPRGSTANVWEISTSPKPHWVTAPLP